MREFWAALFACVFLLLVPVVEAQRPVSRCSQECFPKDADVNGPHIKTKGPVKVILYGHWEDILSMAPLNTQLPDKDQEPDLNRGFLMPYVANKALQLAFNNNQFQMFSSPGLVEYQPDGWRTHQAPGLAADVRIVPGENLILYWYMSAHSIPSGSSTTSPGNAANVGVAPQVAVYARMNTGRMPFEGDLIAESHDLTGARGIGTDHRVNMISSPTNPKTDVYEFKIPLRVKSPTIPSSEAKQGFVVFIHPYQIKMNSGDEADQVSQSEFRIRTGYRYPPRLILPVQNPLESLDVEVLRYNGSLYVKAAALSPFGSYDVDDKSFRIRIESPTGREVPAEQSGPIRRFLDCGGQFKPATVTWKVNESNLVKEAGTYRIQVSADNSQGTYRIENSNEYRVWSFGEGASVDVPGLTGFGLASALLLGALLTSLHRSRRARTER